MCIRDRCVCVCVSVRARLYVVSEIVRVTLKAVAYKIKNLPQTKTIYIRFKSTHLASVISLEHTYYTLECIVLPEQPFAVTFFSLLLFLVTFSAV